MKLYIWLCIICVLWTLLVIKLLNAQSDPAVVNIQVSSPPDNVVRIPEYKNSGTVKVQLSEVARNNKVDITCKALSTLSGDTKIVFIKTSIQVGQQTATVSFNVISTGRIVKVQCLAQSANGGLQFDETISAGTPGYIQVTKRPTVSVCSDVIVVPNQAVVNGNFDVLFSENVTSNPVNVTCDILSPLKANSSPMNIKFFTKSAPINTMKTKVLYELVSKGDAVIVSCKANSVSTTTPTRNLQYTMDSSQGTTAVFTYQVPQATFIPTSVKSLGQTTIGRTVSYLVLEKPATNVIQFQCSLEVHDLSKKPSCSGPTGLQTTSIKMTSVAVNLVSNNMTFEVGELYKPLVVQVNGTNTDRDQQLVDITCCRKNADPKYYELATTMSLWVDVFPSVQFTWGNVSDSSTGTSFSQYDLLCPCDLRLARCDVGCCCDEDCTSIEKDAFSCIPGYFGGGSDEDKFEYGCQETFTNSRNYVAVLCVLTDNNPFLGMLYEFSSSPAADSVQFDALSKKVSEDLSYDYREDEERLLVENDVINNDVTTSGYQAGVVVKTDSGFLTLPQTFAGGACAQHSPVVFLRNVESQCNAEFSEMMCNAASPWSALNYLVPSAPTRSYCATSPQVLNVPSEDNSTRVPTHVAYYCTKDTSDFITVFDADWGEADSKRSTFEDTITGDNLNDVSRCAFDDDVTAPASPWFNASVETCHNVVLKVEYNIYWRGTEVVQLRVIVTMGDVQVATSQGKYLIGQRFSVKFIHLKDVDTSQLPFVESDIRTRSGNPGYLVGSTVLAMTNQSSFTNLNESVNPTWAELDLWLSSSAGLCSTATTFPVTFGVNALSGCLLKLSLKDMANCTELRETVLKNQERLVRASYVAKRGSVELNNTGDWMILIRPPSPLQTSVINETLGTNISNGGGSNQTLATDGSTNQTFTRCDYIPAGLHYELLIKEVGEIQGVKQTEIIGARYKYSLQSWSFQCNSYNCEMCNNDTVANDGTCTDNVQSFEVTSSVVFLPVIEVKRQKRSADTSNICYGDSCVTELFYPLTTAYDGETREVAIAYGLVLVALIMLVVVLTTSCLPTIIYFIFQ